MTAHAHLTHTRSRSLPAGTVRPRLPWWAVALPVVAFCGLLALTVLGGGDADAAQHGTEPLTRLLERLQQAFV